MGCVNMSTFIAQYISIAMLLLANVNMATGTTPRPTAPYIDLATSCGKSCENGIGSDPEENSGHVLHYVNGGTNCVYLGIDDYRNISATKGSEFNTNSDPQLNNLLMSFFSMKGLHVTLISGNTRLYTVRPTTTYRPILIPNAPFRYCYQPIYAGRKFEAVSVYYKSRLPNAIPCTYRKPLRNCRM